MIKPKVAFWEAGSFPANQRHLKNFYKAPIGWKKAGPPKKPLLFWLCKQANSEHKLIASYLKIKQWPFISELRILGLNSARNVLKVQPESQPGP